MGGDVLQSDLIQAKEEMSFAESIFHNQIIHLAFS